MKTYYTHDNGGRPFKVIVDKTNHNITVYREIDYNNNNTIYNETTPVIQQNYTQLFIGKTYKNSMTNFSGGYGKGFIGNSILIKNDEGNNYTFIGHSIFSFQSVSPIVKYRSPVGNNDVPYPFAIDENGTYYLLIENVMVSGDNKPTNVDVYQYYYSESKVKGYSLLVETPSTIVNTGNNNNIEDVEDVEEETYWVQYDSDPSATFDRIVSPESKLYIIENANSNSRVRTVINTDNKTELSKVQYIQYIENIGRTKGFQLLINKVEIIGRL